MQVVPAAVAEELRSTLAATRADLGQRTAEVTSALVALTPVENACGMLVKRQIVCNMAMSTLRASWLIFPDGYRNIHLTSARGARKAGQEVGYARQEARPSIRVHREGPDTRIGGSSGRRRVPTAESQAILERSRRRSLREELRAVALKVQMAKEDAGRVLELGHVRGGSARSYLVSSK